MATPVEAAVAKSMTTEPNYRAANAKLRKELEEATRTIAALASKVSMLQGRNIRMADRLGKKEADILKAELAIDELKEEVRSGARRAKPSDSGEGLGVREVVDLEVTNPSDAFDSGSEDQALHAANDAREEDAVPEFKIVTLSNGETRRKRICYAPGCKSMAYRLGKCKAHGEMNKAGTFHTINYPNGRHRRVRVYEQDGDAVDLEVTNPSDAFDSGSEDQALRAANDTREEDAVPEFKIVTLPNGETKRKRICSSPGCKSQAYRLGKCKAHGEMNKAGTFHTLNYPNGRHRRIRLYERDDDVNFRTVTYSNGKTRRIRLCSAEGCSSGADRQGRCKRHHGGGKRPSSNPAAKVSSKRKRAGDEDAADEDVSESVRGGVCEKHRADSRKTGSAVGKGTAGDATIECSASARDSTATITEKEDGCIAAKRPIQAVKEGVNVSVCNTNAKGIWM